MQNKTLAQELALLKEKLQKMNAKTTKATVDENSLRRQEINIYCKYLTGKEADEQSLSLFQRAIQHEETILNDEGTSLLQFMISNLLEYRVNRLGFRFVPSQTPVTQTNDYCAFLPSRNQPWHIWDFFKPRAFSRLYLTTLHRHTPAGSWA